MNAIQFLSAQPWVERLGLTLLHFLWQGAVIAGIYAIARLAARSSHSRYLLGCAALSLMAIVPLITWIALAPAEATVARAAGLTQAHGAPVTQWLVFIDDPARGHSFFPWVVAAWLAGAAALWIRLLGGWMVTERLRFHNARPAPPEWQQRFNALRERVRLTQPVRLLVSTMVHAPTVVGCLRPVVLVPLGALAGLPPDQLEALLLHELAHIRRQDYLINLLQSVVEALLFYHPAVWWISAHVRTEREHCCDDAAVALTGDALVYARALADLESARQVHLRTAMAASGGNLADRIARLLGYSRPSTARL